MILFREKWLWAVCLAILVHVGFFFIFYINANKKESTPVTNDRIDDMANTSMANDNSKDLPPNVAKTVTVTTTKNIDKSSQKPTTEAQSTTATTATTKPLSPSKTDETLVAQTLTEKSLPAATKTVTPKTFSTLKERAQKFENTNPQTDDTSIATPSNSKPSDATLSNATRLKNHETLENVKAQAGLLSIDVPTEQPDVKNVKTDQAYRSAKSEVEDINNQLSAAINEVKKRNQQKIDEAQRLRNSASMTEDKDAQNAPE